MVLMIISAFRTCSYSHRFTSYDSLRFLDKSWNDSELIYTIHKEGILFYVYLLCELSFGVTSVLYDKAPRPHHLQRRPHIYSPCKSLRVHGSRTCDRLFAPDWFYVGIVTVSEATCWHLLIPTGSLSRMENVIHSLLTARIIFNIRTLTRAGAGETILHVGRYEQTLGPHLTFARHSVVSLQTRDELNCNDS